MANQIPPPVNAWAAGVTCPSSDSWDDIDLGDAIKPRWSTRRNTSTDLMRNVAPVISVISAALPPPENPPCQDNDFNLTVVLENIRTRQLDFSVWNSRGPSEIGPECPMLIEVLATWMRQSVPDSRIRIGEDYWMPVRITLRGREKFEEFCGRVDSDPSMQLVGSLIIANDCCNNLVPNFYAVGYSREQIWQATRA